MAKALKCTQCNTLLANVKEAQTHNDLTGHTAFEETTETLKVMKCTTCGKPCRTDAERDMHKRFTGHAEFVEQDANAMEIDTEKQMAEAKEELMDEADLVKKQLKAAKAGGAGGGSSSGAAAAGTSAADGEGTSGGGAAAAAGEGGEMVAPEVDQALVTELEGMGFGRNRGIRAVYHTGGAGVEAAVNWLMEHENDADLDTPLLVTKASEDASSKLTPEERKRKAAELIKAAKEKREREERELAAHRERERIRAGKEMLAAKKKDDELAMKRLVEQRAREKAEEAAARAKIQAQLEEDRKARRRKLGLPEELTEEEKAREAQKAAEKAAAEEASKKKIFGHVKPVSTLEKLRGTLVTMKKDYSAEEPRWRTCASTLSKYVANIASNPDEEKFRSIKLSNAAFQQRVSGLTGSIDFLHLCGFETQASPDGEVLHMPRDKVNRDVLEGAMGALNDMLTNPFFGAL